MRALAEQSAAVEDHAGATITAGFTDAHVHLTTWALARRNVDLSGAATIEEAADRARSSTHSQREWILGQGWNRHRFSRDPTRNDLDQAVSDRPVLLDSQDIHSYAFARCMVSVGSQPGLPCSEAKPAM